MRDECYNNVMNNRENPLFDKQRLKKGALIGATIPLSLHRSTCTRPLL